MPGTPNAGPFEGDFDEARTLRERLVRALASETHEERVLAAMRTVPRHLFVPDVSVSDAYRDEPMPIGFGQTISQPTIVAIMSAAAELRGGERVLEIGTGSGYQAAILGLLAREVFSVELIPELAAAAAERLLRFGFGNVHVRAGDGYAGWPEAAPFDRIVVTAAPETVPPVLLEQLGEEGILVAPIGPTAWGQELLRFRKAKGGVLSVDHLGGVRFVPLVPKG